MTNAIEKKQSVLKLTQLAVLTAITLIMGLTPLGFIPVNPVLTVTTMCVPIFVAAVLCGKYASAYIGLIFGITSVAQAFIGTSSMGVLFVSKGMYLQLFLLAVPTRVLVGFLSGLIFENLRKVDKKGAWSYEIGALLTSWLNTVLYIGALAVIGTTVPEIRAKFGAGDKLGIALFAAAIAAVLTNAIIESLVMTIISVPVSKVLEKAVKKIST